jgi:hypothetical protein
LHGQVTPHSLWASAKHVASQLPFLEQQLERFAHTLSTQVEQPAFKYFPTSHTSCPHAFAGGVQQFGLVAQISATQLSHVETSAPPVTHLLWLQADAVTTSVHRSLNWQS